MYMINIKRSPIPLVIQSAMATENPTFVYILSPVREVTKYEEKIIRNHVESVKNKGDIVFNPVEDAPQEDKTGYNIVMKELNFLNMMSGENNRVDILWKRGGKKASEGSRVDTGMVYSLGLRINLVTIFNKDKPTGPQLAFKMIKEITDKNGLETPYQDRMDERLRKFIRDGEEVINWDMKMISEDQEWQRINLGLALGYMAKNPDFKIRMGKLTGEDPVDKKSYPKVIDEIERRQYI